MASSEPFITIDDLSGGLHTAMADGELDPREVTLAENVEWFNSRMPRKRAGSASQSLSSWSPTSCDVVSLVRHLPTGGVTLQELWAFTNKATTTIGRLAGGTTWAGVTPSPDDGPSGATNPKEVYGSSFNGKLVLAFPNAAGRMHVWDGTTLRRMGVAATAAPTVANTGAGAYAATIRYYKVAFAYIDAPTIVRQGELSPSVAFTPSGAGTHAQITQPTPPGEGENYWRIYASPDNVNFYFLVNVLVGTTTHDDNTAVSAYSAGTLAPDADEHLNATAARYVEVMDNRVFFGGSTTYPSRIWFTPTFGESNLGDDERVPADHYVDIDPSHAGRLVGMVALHGAMLVWKQDALYKLVRTGEESAPYVVVPLGATSGAIRQAAICLGEDAQGNPAAYWASSRGVCQWSPAGITTVTDKILAYWTQLYPGCEHLQYWPERRQLWVWVARANETTPNTVLVYHVPTGAWWTYTNGASGTTGIGRATCSAIFAETPGASMSYRQVPWMGQLVAGSTPTILKANSGTQDNSVSFQGRIRTKALPIAGPMHSGGVTEAQVTAQALSGQSLQLSLEADYGAETRTVTASLTAAGTEGRVIRKFEDAALTSAQVVRVTIGDSAAANSGAWEVDQVLLRVRQEQVR